MTKIWQICVFLVVMFLLKTNALQKNILVSDAEALEEATSEQKVAETTTRTRPVTISSTETPEVTTSEQDTTKMSLLDQNTTTKVFTSEQENMTETIAGKIPLGAFTEQENMTEMQASDEETTTEMVSVATTEEDLKTDALTFDQEMKELTGAHFIEHRGLCLANHYSDYSSFDADEESECQRACWTMPYCILAVYNGEKFNCRLVPTFHPMKPCGKTDVIFQRVDKYDARYKIGHLETSGSGCISSQVYLAVSATFVMKVFLH